MMRSEDNNEKQGRRSRIHTIVATMVLAGARVAAAQQQTGGEIGTPEPASQRRIIISVPDRKLALVENGSIVKVYRVAVGKRVTASPTGEFKIINRLTNPTYYHKGKVIGPGKDNPLGNRWIGLSTKGYGIHGTNEPRSIGKAASHGCIRMGKRDLEQLFEIVRVGDTVEIRGERDTVVAQIFGGDPVQPSLVASAMLGAAGQN